jgi:ribosome-binding factor A
MRSQRQLRVGEEIRHALAALFMRGDIPWPQGKSNMPGVTVTEVQVSPDLKNATIFVMPLGGQKLEETVGALNQIVGHFRHAVAQAVKLRYAPRLRFSADNSFTYAQRIDDILHKPDVAKDLGKSEIAEEDDVE